MLLGHVSELALQGESQFSEGDLQVSQQPHADGHIQGLWTHPRGQLTAWRELPGRQKTALSGGLPRTGSTGLKASHLLSGGRAQGMSAGPASPKLPEVSSSMERSGS